MLVHELAAYLRILAQEPDSTFLDDSTLTSILKMGYADFRSAVKQVQPDFYATSVSISPSSDSYDLALATNPVVLLGDPAFLTNPGLSRILELREDDEILQGVTARRALDDGAGDYMLRGTTLWFYTQPSTLSLIYDPKDSTDWTQLAPPVAPATGEFIDDLSEFHDLIALNAARRYHVLDASTNDRLDIEIQVRSAALQEFLALGRGDDDSYIQRVDEY